MADRVPVAMLGGLKQSPDHSKGGRHQWEDKQQDQEHQGAGQTLRTESAML